MVWSSCAAPECRLEAIAAGYEFGAQSVFHLRLSTTHTLFTPGYGLGNFNNVKRPLKFLARALIVAIALAVSAFAGPVLVSGLVNGSFLGGTAI